MTREGSRGPTGRHAEGAEGEGPPGAPLLDRPSLIRRHGPPRDRRLVFTNGVFDVLHPGHVRCLARARELGDLLVVGVNSDASARRVKGTGRPVQAAGDRARVVGALRFVDAVTVFDEETPEALVRALLPDVLVKGADYDAGEVAGGEAVIEAGGRVELVPLVEGPSTTRILRRARAGEGVPAAADRPPAPDDPGEPGDPRPYGSRLLVATRSPHKMEEIEDLLAGLPWEVLSLAGLGLPPVPEEDGIESYETFEENALAKARHFHRRAGLFTVADDSGLCVDALDGGPGVHTKRFAPSALVEQFGRDEANNRYLLERLEGVPEEERTARYRCSLAAWDGRRSRVWHGQVEGRIARRPRGEGGFGYDPVFLPPEGGGTFAELPPEVKASMSHRARAVEKFRDWLASRGSPDR